MGMPAPLPQPVPHLRRLPEFEPSPAPSALGGDFVQLTQLTADALQRSVQAVLSTDQHPAPRRLRNADIQRRTLCTVIQKRARHHLAAQSSRSVSPRRLLCQSLLISDLGRINDLIDTLTGLTVSLSSPLVAGRDRQDILGVANAGALRLRSLAAGLPIPAMDADYLRAGLTLREAAEHLSLHAGELARNSEPAKTAASCAALAESVLLASRHAADAAAGE